MSKWGIQQAMRKTLGKTLLVLLAAFAVPAFAQSSSQPTVIAHIVKIAVAAMPSNFASLQGKRTDGDQFYDEYAVTDPNIPQGRIDHSLATPQDREYWECFFVVMLPNGTTIQDASDVAASTLHGLGPTPGYMIMGALDKDTGATIYTWRQSATERVVATPFVKKASGTDPAETGIAFSVRKYIVDNPHYAMFSQGLTPDDQTRIAGAFNTEIQTGLQNALANFMQLRNKLTKSGNVHSTYETNLQFALPYSTCEVDSDLFPAGSTADNSHWTLSCTTPAIFNAPYAWDSMHGFVAKALPANYVERMNFRTRLATVMSDKAARWDSPDGQTSVLLEETPDDEDGGMTYTVSVIHFIPNGTQ